MPAIKPLNRSTVKNYACDNMNRLTSAAAADGHWSDTYTYDGWGNMKSKASVGGISIPNFGVNSQNQATAVYSYDAAGAGYDPVTGRGSPIAKSFSRRAPAGQSSQRMVHRLARRFANPGAANQEPTAPFVARGDHGFARRCRSAVGSGLRLDRQGQGAGEFDW